MKKIIILFVTLVMTSCGVQLTPASYYPQPKPVYTNYTPQYYYHPRPYYSVYYYGGYNHNYGHSHGHR